MSAVLKEKLSAVNSGKTVHSFVIPDKLRSPGGPAKVGIQQLNADQELLASKLGSFHYLKAQYAAVKLAIVEFDSKPVAVEDVDVFWEKSDPRLRSLLMQAYNKMTSPSQEDESSFFESEEIRVG